ncbi:TPA: LOW QUALITY PROTEIN: hypothetical protein N0F65_002690 [Lagenidium giganteum]|uniref:Uncharacterized protein n=1 Tax=Lagenidium giganteum TaxID=4803 RepID=A0AAV2Z5J7_9STRA|nr:TPA: LOW QUALITY PROTEIN: hypothetical protein N0F65_002690 [Lagenidium giganteum]
MAYQRPMLKATVVDVTAQMKNTTYRLALENLAEPASSVWAAVNTPFYLADTDNVLTGLTEQQVINRLYWVRHKHYSECARSGRGAATFTGESVNFFKFHNVISSTTGKGDRMIGWAHPSLINLLRYQNTTIFMCATKFRAMCYRHGPRSRIRPFVPVFYVLTTVTTSDTYWDVINSVVQATDQKLEPAQAQALRRKIKQLCISEPQAQISLARGVLNMLTVILPGKIRHQGVAWVKQEMKAQCARSGCGYSTQKWRKFWAYFRLEWLERIPSKFCNVIESWWHAQTTPWSDSTDNLAAHFQAPHPSIPVFVTTICALSKKHAVKLESISKGKSRRKTREKTDS